MRVWIGWLVSSFVLLPALGGCGGSSSSSSTTARSTHHRAPAHSAHYVVRLTGNAETPRGAPGGSGVAVIALHGRSLHLCWRFAHLHGFTDATYAHIHRGAPGTAGPIVVPLSTHRKLHHEGCVRSTVAIFNSIEHDPAGYYVNIHSGKYPGGAVRGQL